MAGVLDAALAKAKWARKRLDELSDAISSSEFTKTQVNFQQTFDSLTNRIDVTIADTPETNHEWSLMAADAVQNLRTALNYVVWELAKWNLGQQGIEREPKKSTQFPIAIKEADFQAQFVQDLHPNHVAIIRFLQPFGPPHLARFTDKFLSEFSEPGASHPLAKLAHLSNTDKHRMLQLAIAGAAKSIFGLTRLSIAS